MAREIRLSISGMVCAGCVSAVEEALQAVDGVTTATVNLGERSASVHGSVTAAPLIEAIVQAGFNASELVTVEDQEQKAQQEQAEYNALLWRTAVAGVIGIALFTAGMGGFLPVIETGKAVWMGISMITLLVLIFVGGHFFQGAWISLRNRRGNMDTLIAMGTGTAWLYSTAIVLFPESVPSLARHAYFEAAVIIVALVSLGSALEMRSRGKTSEAIQKLIGLQPKQAHVIRNGIERDVLLEEVGLDETLRIRPGEKVPLDGVVLDGDTFVDESMLTGESMPIHKSREDEVVGGTINGSGSILIQTTRIGRETVLAQIVELVRKAQSSKPEIGRIVDRIAAIFVPVVVVIALVSFALWFWMGPDPQLSYAIVAAMTVLVIACPCALGLATPISIMVGVGRAAGMGILIRNGEALQRSETVTTVVFDKTGTLTEGSPSVVSVTPLSGYDEERLLQLAAAIEQHSEHPLASAIVTEAKERGLSIPVCEQFQSKSGQGVCGHVGESQIRIGNAVWIEQNKIDTAEHLKTIQQCASHGGTPVCVAVDNEWVGIIGIADPVKPEARETIDRLHEIGLKVVMLTGDHQKTAQVVADSLGVEQVVAEVLPADKANQVQKLQASGEQVLMVGDGINDAPALAQADVGMAIGTGTDVAIESADITLMRGALDGVTHAILLSRATMRNIRQNLFGAFVYNTLGIPIAAGVLFPLFGVLLSPVVAAAAMSMSSVTVVTNALRLRKLSL